MRAIAFVVPVSPRREAALPPDERELRSRRNEYDAFRRKIGVRREAAFLQHDRAGSQLIIYRELDGSATSRPGLPVAVEGWLTDGMSALHGIDPSSAGEASGAVVIRPPPPPRRKID